MRVMWSGQGSVVYVGNSGGQGLSEERIGREEERKPVLRAAGVIGRSWYHRSDQNGTPWVFAR